jgi:hypothetical protein
MKREHAINVVSHLTRYRDQRCTRPARSGYCYIKQTFFPRCTRAEELRAEKTAVHAYEKVQWIRADRVKSTQGCLGPRRLIYQLRRHPLKKLPTVIPMRGGWFLLWDGNHRATASVLLGKTKIKCQVLRK